MKQNQIIVIAVVVLLVGAGAFFVGIQYQKMQRNQFGQGRFNGQTAGSANSQFRSGQNGMGRPVNGEIISSEDKSITVKLPDGSSKIVFVNDQSKIMEATAATKESLTTGKNVMIFGTTNQDGSVTASNIQLGSSRGMNIRERGQSQP